jgi:DNA-binding Lrp family transcriptional regulator
MKNLLRIPVLILLLLSSSPLWSQPITRLVFFNLSLEAGTTEADSFFEKSMVLKEVPSVKEFKILKVEGNMAEYDYVIRLVFEDYDGVEEYVKHRIHTDYLEEVWKPHVSKGKLIDLVEFLPEE